MGFEFLGHLGQPAIIGHAVIAIADDHVVMQDDVDTSQRDTNLDGDGPVLA